MSETRLPNFLGIGASRSGTTTLWNCLKQHPEIFMPSKKELHFFSREVNFGKGVEAYKSHFSQATEHQVIGEISPTYFYKGRTSDVNGNVAYNDEDDCPIRIKRLMPDVKLIITLRNPVDRMYSQYAKRLLTGTESGSSFGSVIEEELEGKRSPETTHGSYIHNSSYHLHIEKWLSVFPRAQCHFMILEQWAEHPSEEFGALFKFLGVNTDFEPPALGHYNRGKKSNYGGCVKKLGMVLPQRFRSAYHRLTTRKLEPVSTADRIFVENIMQSSIRELESLIDLDLTTWRNT